ncbi:MAG: helix-turn-helix domain-containing protein [Pseudomonadota bacterium]
MSFISPAQSRAARALLEWSQPNLADYAGVTTQTVLKFEKEGPDSVAHKTMATIAGAFRREGIEFLEDDGVKRTNNTVTLWEGETANRTMLDDIYRTLGKTGGEVIIAGLKEVPVVERSDFLFLQEHLDRLKKAGITERILVEEGDSDFVAPAEWYRWLPRQYFSANTFQLYGDKLAIITWGPPQKIVVINNPLTAQAFRTLFNFVWDNALIPPSGDGDD